MSARWAAGGRLSVFRHGRRQPICITTAVLVGCATGLISRSPAFETSTDAPATSCRGQVELTLRVQSLAGLVKPGELFGELPKPVGLGVDRIVAFEDNPTFLYLCGISTQDASGENADSPPRRRAPQARHVRRIFLLKPSVFVVDDQVRAGGPMRVAWALESKGPLGLRGEDLSGEVGEDRFLCRTLLPERDKLTGFDLDAPGTHTPKAISLLGQTTSQRVRLLHLVHFERQGEPVVRGATLRRDDRTVHLEILVWDELRATHRTVKLSLPDGRLSGNVGVSDREGDGLLDIPMRPLPAGILPMGEVGFRKLQGWDIPYRDLSQRLATWDTGRPSSQLKEVVELGTVRPCRAVELGCGTGTDAVYLAGKGFDVTAIDIAPTALRLAEKKAHKAGVNVEWLLADVLRTPRLEPFDFLYDRGCYHAVRRDDPRRYVATVRRLTRPRSRILILAGNANEDSHRRFAGPPGVKEEEIRGDFAQGFKLTRLRTFRFDPTPGESRGALAWSVLLERVADEGTAARARQP